MKEDPKSVTREENPYNRMLTEFLDCLGRLARSTGSRALAYITPLSL